MASREQIMADMKQLGFSEYECKAYLSLLAQFPVNGYALSKASGVPRSRIYEVLKNLMDKQMVFEQVRRKDKQYYPVEPDVFISRLKNRYHQIFEGLSAYAGRLYSAQEKDDQLVVIQGRGNIISFLKLLIKGAEKRIAVSIWEEELLELTRELNRAQERGVVLKGIFFGHNNPFPGLTPHRRMKRYMAEKSERYMAVVIDKNHTLSGIVSREEATKVTWTRDEGVVEVTEDYIAHDLLVNLYSASLDKQQYEAFETFTDKVRKDFYQFSDIQYETFRSLTD